MRNIHATFFALIMSATFAFSQNVGIGTNNPTDKLTVVGTTKTDTLKIPTDAHQDWVLTSDADGKGSWKPPQTTGNTTTITDLLFPDVTNWDSIQPITLSLVTPTSYTVPAGKNLYILNVYSILSVNSGNGSVVLSQNNNNQFTLHNPIILGSGTIVLGGGSSATPTNINGFLVDAKVTPVSRNLSSTSYTVPSGKRLVILSAQYDIKINGIVVAGDAGVSSYTVGLPFIVNSSQVISGVNLSTFNGYLK